MEIIRMKRKTISVSADEDRKIIVKAPFFVPQKVILDFVSARQKDIEKMVLEKKKRAERLALFSEEELYRKAKEILPERIEYFSGVTGLKPVSVKITSAKTRYGSCSSLGRICFSKYLMCYETDVIDYVVLHEIAHLKFMNHSREFYAFIENIMPDYKDRVKKLRNGG